MPKNIFANVGDLTNSLHGSVTIPKAGILSAKDPDARRKEIADQYTEQVQKHPELEFGILVDQKTDEIRITWRKRD